MNKLALVYVRQWLFLTVLAVSTVWLPVVMAMSKGSLFERIFYPSFIGVILAAFAAKAIKDLLAMKLDDELRRQIVSLWMILGGGAAFIVGFRLGLRYPFLFAQMVFWGVVILAWGFARFRDEREAISDVAG